MRLRLNFLVFWWMDAMVIFMSSSQMVIIFGCLQEPVFARRELSCTSSKQSAFCPQSSPQAVSQPHLAYPYQRIPPTPHSLSRSNMMYNQVSKFSRSVPSQRLLDSSLAVARPAGFHSYHPNRETPRGKTPTIPMYLRAAFTSAIWSHIPPDIKEQLSRAPMIEDT